MARYEEQTQTNSLLHRDKTRVLAYSFEMLFSFISFDLTTAITRVRVKVNATRTDTALPATTFRCQRNQCHQVILNENIKL